jgi:hypothetical protein
MRGPAKGEARLPSPRFGPFLGPRFSPAAAPSVSWDAEDLVRELFPPAAGELLAELLAGASDDLPLRLSTDLAA